MKTFFLVDKKNGKRKQYLEKENIILRMRRKIFGKENYNFCGGEEKQRRKRRKIFFSEKKKNGKEREENIWSRKIFFWEENYSSIKLIRENVFLGWTINLLGAKMLDKKTKHHFFFLNWGFFWSRLALKCHLREAAKNYLPDFFR